MEKFQVTVDHKLCKACGICYAFCLKRVLVGGQNGEATVVASEACIGCELCEMRCPDYAIRVRREIK